MVFINQHIYVFGGNSNQFGGSTGILSDVHYYNEKDNKWEQVKFDDFPKVYAFAYDVYKSNIILFAGYTGSKSTNNLYLLNIKSKNISKINYVSNNITIKTRCDLDCCMHKNYLYIFGGQGARDDKKIYIIDLEKKKVDKAVELKIDKGRCDHTMLFKGSKLCCMKYMCIYLNVYKYM